MSWEVPQRNTCSGTLITVTVDHARRRSNIERITIKRLELSDHTVNRRGGFRLGPDRMWCYQYGQQSDLGEMP